MESGGAGDEEGVIRGAGGCLVQPGSDTSPPRGQPPGALNAGGDVRRGRGQSAAPPPASCTHRGTQAAPVPSLLEAGAPAAGGAVRMRVQTACVPWCQAPCACADGVCRRCMCLDVRPRVRVQMACADGVCAFVSGPVCVCCVAHSQEAQLRMPQTADRGRRRAGQRPLLLAAAPSPGHRGGPPTPVGAGPLRAAGMER